MVGSNCDDGDDCDGGGDDCDGGGELDGRT